MLGLVKDGRVTGLRVDHIDGLFDPEAYLKRLQDRVADVEKSPEAKEQKFYLVVEKILAEDETIPASWPVAGAPATNSWTG